MSERARVDAAIDQMVKEADRLARAHDYATSADAWAVAADYAEEHGRPVVAMLSRAQSRRLRVVAWLSKRYPQINLEMTRPTRSKRRGGKLGEPDVIRVEMFGSEPIYFKVSRRGKIRRVKLADVYRYR